MHMADLPTPPRYQLPRYLSATNHRHVQPKLTPPIGCFPELLDMTKIAQFALVRHSSTTHTRSLAEITSTMIKALHIKRARCYPSA
ncbi:hypothetical protein B0T12DRAFT_92809 [Alternaria alternata]|nr:hypothetical protein B0T12DRAFT_92809 [Alternaria alternata]